MASLANLNPNAAEAQCVLGGAGTGKTQALVERVAALLENGTQPADMAVFAATPNAALALKGRLAERAGSSGAAVRVETVRSFALDVLGSDEARAFTGREPRLLAPFEMSVLMEDVKTTGIRLNRLREMLKFLYRGWTELADDDPDWIITQEEELVVRTLKGSLTLTQGLLEPEIANLAVNYLRSDSAALEAHARAYVLVDDYQAHSLASHVLVGMLARTSLWVAGDPYLQGEVFESFPHAASLTQLAEAEGTKTQRLEASFRAPAAVAAANALLQDSCFGEAAMLQGANENSETAEFAVLSFPSPEKELQGAAAEVARLVDEGLQPGDIFVAAPNKTWLKNMAAALAKNGIAANTMPSARLLAGDVRNVNTCTASMVFTALALVAQPRNALAWRNWCGFGDHLASSPLFDKLREKHLETGTSLVNQLERLSASDGGSSLDGEPIYNMQYALDAYAAGKSIVANTEHMRGMELLKALTRTVTGNSEAAVPVAVLQLCGPVTSDDTAQALYERAVHRLTLPSFANNPQAVKLGGYEDAVGLNPQVVVLVGFVNGFFPNHQFFDDTKLSIDQRNRVHAVDTKKLYALVSKANARLCATYFTETSLETAGALNLKVDRIRLRHGKRVCAVSPSVFLQTIAGN